MSNINFDIFYRVVDIERGYYADKEDAYDMRKYFKESERKESNKKPIDINCDLKFEEIKDCLEDVDANGEEQGENKKLQQMLNEEVIEDKEEGKEDKESTTTTSTNTTSNTTSDNTGTKKKSKKKKK